MNNGDGITDDGKKFEVADEQPPIEVLKMIRERINIFCPDCVDENDCRWQLRIILENSKEIWKPMCKVQFN